MGAINVLSGTQRIVVKRQQRIVVEDRVPRVLSFAQRVTVSSAGQIGPPGVMDLAPLEEHIDSPTPHPAYDDIPDLVTHFENGLF